MMGSMQNDFEHIDSANKRIGTSVRANPDIPTNVSLTAAHPKRVLKCVVPPEMDGLRVERVLVRQLGVSVGIMRRAKLMENGICVDGARARTVDRAHAGQTISIVVSDAVEKLSDCWMAPANLPLEIVYEDADLLVVDKPAGVVMYPDHRHPQDALANRVLGHYARNGWQIDYHPIHRLDRGTSGLVLIAKHAHAQEQMNKQLHTSQFVRQYLAICEGTPGNGCVDAPIGRMGDYSEHRFGVREDGKCACTHFCTEKTLPPRSMHTTEAGAKKPLALPHRSLLRLQLTTGRTHQIRVHMAHIGHPLIGDALYGAPSAAISRPALHSAYVRFAHPITKETLEFQSPLPDDIQSLL